MFNVNVCSVASVSKKISRVIKQYKITNRIVIIWLYRKMNKYMGCSVLNSGNDTN
jgi:hypothetical protein